MVKDSQVLANVPSSLVNECQGDKDGKNAKPRPWLDKAMRLKWQDGARFADLAELERLGRRYQQVREAGWTGKASPSPSSPKSWPPAAGSPTRSRLSLLMARDSDQSRHRGQPVLGRPSGNAAKAEVR